MEPTTVALRERIEKLRNVLLFIAAYDGTFRASDAAEFWRAASAGLIADNNLALRPSGEPEPGGLDVERLREAWPPFQGRARSR